MIAIFAGGIMMGAFKLMKCPFWWPSVQQIQSVKDETASWQKYEHEENRYEIKYPDDWSVTAFADEVEISKSTSGSYLKIIEEINENNLNLDEWFKELTIIYGRPTLKASAQPIFINNVKAYMLDSGLEPPNPLFEIVGIADSRNRIFSLYAYSELSTDNKILKQILSTFKFVEKKENDNQYNVNQYNIFGESEFDAIMSGYLEIKKWVSEGNEMTAEGMKGSTAYFVITKFYDENFKNSLDEGINEGNTVNGKEDGLYKFNLGCFEDGKIKGIEYEKDKTYIDEETMKKILSSSKENPISIILYFGLHGGFGCSCCNLAHQVRIYEETTINP